MITIVWTIIIGLVLFSFVFVQIDLRTKNWKHLKRIGDILVTIKQESPWKTYKHLYTIALDSDRDLVVAEKITLDPGDTSLVSIRSFSDPDLSEKIRFIRQVRHEKIVSALGIFHAKDEFYAVFEFLPLSIFDIVGHNHLNEVRLASILGQVYI